MAEWRSLEARALEGNAYLSPDFVLPFVRHVGLPGNDIRVIAVFDASARSPRLAVLGLFRDAPGDRRFPLAHLQAYANNHSYLTGLLVDAADADGALDAFFAFVTGHDTPWHGIRFDDWRADGPVGQAMLRAARRAGATWHGYEGFARAALVPARLTSESFDAALARVEGSSWRKKVGRMLERGEIGWRLLRGPECDRPSLDRFLSLEDRDWTRQAGSSLRASGQDRAFLEIFERFADDGRLFVTELLLRGEVIASTTNFISGPEGFAFKLGWSTAHKHLRPGILNELMFLRAAGHAFARLSYIDSGTQPGSFLERIWEERTSIVSGTFATSRVGRVTGAAWGALRAAKRSAGALWPRRTAADPSPARP